MLTVQDVERIVHPDILGYLRDRSMEMQVTTKLEEVRKSVTGTRYVSKTICNGREMNQKKYKSLLIQYYKTHVEPELEKENAVKVPRDTGKNVTQSEFFELIFRDNFEHRRGETDTKGRRIYLKSFLFNIDHIKKVVNEKKVVRNLEKVLKQMKNYNYFTPNLFISHKFFSKEMLSLLGVIILDIDLDTAGVVMTKRELRRYIHKKLKVEPNLIWDTKTPGNYQVAFLIKNMTGTPKSVHLYESVIKEMIYQLGELCDPSCASAAHIFSIPKNNKQKKRFVRKYHEEVFSINDFRWLLHERDKRREDEDDNKVLDFSYEQMVRHEAIRKLRDGDVSFRNHAAFTLALLYYATNKTQEECENFMYSIWSKAVMEKGDHSFTDRESQHCIKHAYSGKYSGPSSKWISIVTGVDFKYSIRRPNINKGIYKTGNKQQFVQYLIENGGVVEVVQKEIAELLEMAPRTLQRIIQQLKEEGIIDYRLNEGRGRGKCTRIEYVGAKQSDTVIEMDLFKGFEEEMESLQKLEDIFNGKSDAI
jgi:transcription initiation factor IIE alpha subunit